MKLHGSLVVLAAVLFAHSASAEHKNVKATRSYSGGSTMANTRSVDSDQQPEAIDLRAQASLEEAQREADEAQQLKTDKVKKVRRSFSGGNGLANTRVVIAKNSKSH